MKSWVGLICYAAVLLFGGSAFADSPNTLSPSTQPDVQQWQKDYGVSHEQRMQWWRAARFGMFIHWGVYSVPAGTWKGQRVPSIGEWIMHNAKIPVADYAELPKQFNPTKFDADAWVKTAKDAGMKYIVITSKHHDGFAMFHTKVDGYNIYDATPFHRDPLAELAEACKKQGIKLGFYYSQAQDWHHPGGAVWGGPHWDKAQDGSYDDYIDQVAVPQVKELLTNYGDVAVLWWDTPADMTPERAMRFLPLLKLQPNLITDNRLSKSFNVGDYSTPEQEIPDTGTPGKDWETCMTINDTWGYKSYDDKFKSSKDLIRNLIDIASKGGNYLLNVGPTSEGVIPQGEVDRLADIGKWMSVNGEAVYGTTASPIAKPTWGRVTRKADGSAIYLHVFDWPSDGVLRVAGLKEKIESASLLADGSKLEVTSDGTREPNGLAIKLPATAPDGVSSTIVLKTAQ